MNAPVEAPERPVEDTGTDVVPVPPFTEDQKLERCLLALASTNGNSRRAADLLSQDGIEVHHATLWKWRTGKHLERYEQIRADTLPHVRAQAAEEHRDLARRNMEVEALVVDQLKGKVSELDARDLSTASRNLATGAGIHTQRAEEADGLLPENTGKGMDTSEILRKLGSRLGSGVRVEATERTVTVEGEDAS